jgi:hypothetical protein
VQLHVEPEPEQVAKALAGRKIRIATAINNNFFVDVWFTDLSVGVNFTFIIRPILLASACPEKYNVRCIPR